MIYTTSLSHPNMFSTISGKTMLDTTFEAINRRIALLVQTAYTELFGYPQFGCGLYETTFDYADEVMYSTLQSMISDSITKFESTIECTREMITVSRDPNTQHIKITIGYRIKNSEQYGSTDLSLGVENNG